MSIKKSRRINRGEPWSMDNYQIIDSKAIQYDGSVCITVISENWSYIGGSCGIGIFDHILTCANF